MKLRDILKEVSDETIIKYKDADGETKEMPAKSAKTMPMDHPAKKAWDVEKAKEDGGADKKEPEAGQVSFDRTADDGDSTPGPDASAATTLPTSSPGDNPYAAAEAVQAAAEKDPRDFKSLPAEEIEGRLQRMLDPLAYMSGDIIVGDEVEYDGEERGGNPIFTRYEVGGKAQKIIVDRETGELYKLTGSKKGFNKKKPLYDYRKVDGKTQLVVQNIDPRAKPRFVDEETFEISENRMNMKLSSILKENWVVVDPRGNARPVGSKIQGDRYVKGKKGHYVILAKHAMTARRAIEKAGGNATSRKIQDLMYGLRSE